MFWMRNKENNFPIHTLKIIWRPASRPDELVIAAHDRTCHRPLVKSVYQKINFLINNQNICCGYSKEPSQ